MNNRKQANKGSSVIMSVIIAVVLLLNIARNFDEDKLPVFFFVVAALIVFVLITSIASRAKAGKSSAKKQTSVELNRPFPQPTAVKTKQPSPIFRHRDEQEAEEAVRCAHARGKEKYFEQIEGFYRNGLIDRAEYKILREKYEKLDLPEDYH